MATAKKILEVSDMDAHNVLSFGAYLIILLFIASLFYCLFCGGILEGVPLSQTFQLSPCIAKQFAVLYLTPVLVQLS